MAGGPTGTGFDRLLAGLSTDEFARFVADLWAARGWRVEHRDRTLAVSRPGDPAASRTMVVVPDRRSAVRTLVRPPERPVDGLVVRRPLPAALLGAVAAAGRTARLDGIDVVAPGDLHEQFRYAIGADDRDRLVERYAAGEAIADADGHVGPTGVLGGRRATAAWMLSVLVVAGALLWGSPLLSPGSNGDVDVDVATRPTPPTAETTPAPTPTTPTYVDPFRMARIMDGNERLAPGPAAAPPFDVPDGCVSPGAVPGEGPVIPLADLASELRPDNWTIRFASAVRSDRGQYNPNSLHRMNWVPEAQSRMAYASPDGTVLTVRVVRWGSPEAAAARLDDLDAEWHAAIAWGRHTAVADAYFDNDTALPGNRTRELARAAFARLPLRDGTRLGDECVGALLSFRPDPGETPLDP